jgi:menaquinone-specific isochorismate synthase
MSTEALEAGRGLDGSRAYLYAGSGIVRESDPESEYEETRLKLAALLSALHVAL